MCPAAVAVASTCRSPSADVVSLALSVPWCVTGGSVNEVWTRLKRERAIVLWLEARRMGDLRRWQAANAPGDLDPLETPTGDASTGSHLEKQDLCFPVPRSERDTNPNLRG